MKIWLLQCLTLLSLLFAAEAKDAFKILEAQEETVHIKIVSSTTSLSPQPVAAKIAMSDIGIQAVIGSENIMPKMKTIAWKGDVGFGLLPSNLIFVILNLQLSSKATYSISENDLALLSSDGTKHIGVFRNPTFSGSWTASAVGSDKEEVTTEKILFVVNKASLRNLKLYYREQFVGNVILSGNGGTLTKKK